jgi:uncharacterized protein (DUF1810 family)
MPNLKRFLDAQKVNYTDALNEIKSGKKRTHWMWYVFPQVQGLGFSEMSKRYAIDDLAEAQEYLNHPVLGARLIEISQAMLALASNDAYQVLGSPDDMKLQSSMTLFSQVPDADPVFGLVMDKYYQGKADQATLDLLR